MHNNPSVLYHLFPHKSSKTNTNRTKNSASLVSSFLLEHIRKFRHFATSLFTLSLQIGRNPLAQVPPVLLIEACPPLNKDFIFGDVPCGCSSFLMLLLASRILDTNKLVRSTWYSHGNIIWEHRQVPSSGPIRHFLTDYKFIWAHKLFRTVFFESINLHIRYIIQLYLMAISHYK